MQRSIIVDIGQHFVLSKVDRRITTSVVPQTKNVLNEISIACRYAASFKDANLFYNRQLFTLRCTLIGWGCAECARRNLNYMKTDR